MVFVGSIICVSVSKCCIQPSNCSKQAKRKKNMWQISTLTKNSKMEFVTANETREEKNILITQMCVWLSTLIFR